ncbi:MAG TPA: hypothetical protein VHL53_14680 [Acidimicrobiia bacterium]|nr:hypothetical protein [Acidimicrobiia bacterium]
MVISSRTAPAAASPGADPEVRDPTPGPGRRRPSVPLGLAIVAIPAVIAVVRLLLGAHRPFTNYGDDAILEAAVRRVASGSQALGPYSRFGFHQPGPAYFFVQAPFAWLTGGSDRSLFLGAAVINFGAALGSVWIVLRRYGDRAATWTATVVVAYVIAAGPAFALNAWNPYVLALPLLLAILLVADGAAGSLPAGAAALVVGSYLVQTHVAVALTLVAAGAVGVAVFGRSLLARWREERPRRPTAPRRWVALGVAGALLALLWVPPLVEQVTHSPGNLTTLARFFGEKHPEYDTGVDHRLRTASTQVAAQLATLPLGRPPASNHTTGRRLRDGVALAELAGAAVVTTLGWRRRQAFVMTLGAVSVVGAAVAVWSTTRIVGDVMPYLLVWSGVLALPAWIGLGLLVPGPASSAVGWRSVLVAVPVGLGLVLGWSMLRTPLPPVPDNPGVASAAGLVRPWLAAHDARSVRVRLGQHDQWPLAAGVINRLDDAGFDVSVDQPWLSLFGDQFKASGHEPVEVWLTDPGAPPPAPARQRLGEAGGAALWAGPAVAGGER